MTEYRVKIDDIHFKTTVCYEANEAHDEDTGWLLPKYISGIQPPNFQKCISVAGANPSKKFLAVATTLAE